jgi:3-phenylpropionate/trans-cinnamate dioxygenase ferredoxin subunit/naphthalene 1,2-dioxygenase system ferredoxin subunit
MAEFQTVARVSDIPEGRGIAADVGGRRLAIFHLGGGEFRAIEARCAQQRAPLEKGVVVDEHLVCPWHGVTFDLEAGTCGKDPTVRSTETFPVAVVRGEVRVRV